MSREPGDRETGPLVLGEGARERETPDGSPLDRLPDRRYHRIGAVARALGVTPSVLRFWEDAFEPLRPRKGRGGQRLYTREDVELAWTIQRMVHVEGYTHEGVRRRLAGEAPPVSTGDVDRLRQLKTGLEALLDLLDEGVQGRD